MLKRLLVAAAICLSAVASFAQSAPDVTGPYEFMLARLAAESGEFDEALRHMDVVVEMNPDNPVVLFERAAMLADSGKPERARTELQSIVRRFPDLYDAHRYLGRLQLEQKPATRETIEAALRSFQAALKIRPDDVVSGLTAAQLLVASERVADAEKVLSGLAERMPDNKFVSYQYAQVLSKLGRAEESRKYLERAVVSDSTYAPAVFQLVDVYQRAGEWRNAADALSPMVEQEPGNIEMQRQLGYFHLRGGSSEKARQTFELLAKTDPKDERNQFFLAESLSDLEQYREAEAIYKRLLQKSPDDAELLVSSGLNLMAQRRFDDAARAFMKLVNLDNANPGVITLGKTQLALIDLARGDYESALLKAREVVHGPKGLNVQAVNIALDVFRRQRQFEAALEFLRPLMREFGTDSTINARYLEFLLRAGKTEEARAVAEVQKRKGPRGVLTVAETFIAVQRFEEGIKLLEQMRANDPADRPIAFQLASAYERAGNVAAAEKIFLGLLEKEPEDATTMNYLAYMWADRGVNLERAEQLLLKAVAQDPRNGAFIDSLGWAYFKQGKFELAEKHLSDAAALLPFDATVQKHLGDVLTRIGRRDEALERYRTALRLAAEAEEQAEIRSKIAEVEKRGSEPKRQ